MAVIPRSRKYDTHSTFEQVILYTLCSILSANRKRIRQQKPVRSFVGTGLVAAAFAVGMIMRMVMTVIIHLFLRQFDRRVPILLERVRDLRADRIPSLLPLFRFCFRNKTFVEGESDGGSVQRLPNDYYFLLAIAVDFMPKWSDIPLQILRPVSFVNFCPPRISWNKREVIAGEGEFSLDLGAIGEPYEALGTKDSGIVEGRRCLI